MISFFIFCPVWCECACVRRGAKKKKSAVLRGKTIGVNLNIIFARKPHPTDPVSGHPNFPPRKTPPCFSRNAASSRGEVSAGLSVSKRTPAGVCVCLMARQPFIRRKMCDERMRRRGGPHAAPPPSLGVRGGLPWTFSFVVVAMSLTAFSTVATGAGAAAATNVTCDGSHPANW